MSIKVSKSPENTEITVRPVINWLTLLSTLLVAFIVFGVGLGPMLDRIRARTHDFSDTAGLVTIALIFGAVLLAILYSDAKMAFGFEKIFVSGTELRIDSWLLGLNLSKRSFPNNTVENLRYEEWPGGRAGTQRAIRFESAGETIDFGRQADTSDCYEVIDQMQKIYKFPSGGPDGEQISPAVTRW